MPTPITTTTQSFTYNIADKLYGETNLNNKTASASYTGPDRVWVFLDEETKLLSRVSPPLTSLEDGGEVPVPIGHIRVEVVAEDDPIIISMLKEDCVTYADTSQTTEDLPDPYGTITFNAVPTLSQTYDLDEVTYDEDAGSWVLGDFTSDKVSWTDLINARNGMLTASDGRISPDMPESLRLPWVNYRQALRDLPSVYGYGTDNQVDAWKVKFPDQPED